MLLLAVGKGVTGTETGVSISYNQLPFFGNCSCSKYFMANYYVLICINLKVKILIVKFKYFVSGKFGSYKTFPNDEFTHQRDYIYNTTSVMLVLQHGRQ